MAKLQKSGHQSAAGGISTVKIRDRIKEFRRVPAEQLRPSPLNFREHPEEQREAVRAILQEIGYAGAALARELPDGSLELIDGHLRQEESPGQLVPTLILDVNQEEAATLVALYDPLGDLAKVNRDLVNGVLAQINVGADALQVMLLELSGEAAVKAKEEKEEAAAKAGPPEMPLRPYEHYDYVLVLARNTADWQAIAGMLGLEKMDASARKGPKKIGLGRCVDAGKLLRLLQEKQSNAATK